MKIEIGESLLLSWLRHVKECQLVQLNWKASGKWELKNRELLEQLMTVSADLFSEKYNYNLYKGNRSVDQLIGQGEIDVLGISYEEDQSYIYAIDVAFHEKGLNYGSREETVSRIIKKCLRTAMCIYGYFGFTNGSIVFASPKINPSVERELMNCVEDMNLVLRHFNLDFTIRVIGNDEFGIKIVEPVLNVLGEVADTSELFMRSLQMYNLFAGEKSSRAVRQRSVTERKSSPIPEVIEAKGLEGLEEMKIGAIVRTVLRKILEEGKVSREEIERMQTKSFSRETFHIQYPLLQKASLTPGVKPARYYSGTITIFGEEYYLCSEWYEVPANNDRPYLMKWLGMHV
ncbi:hypothetical protein ACERII_05450 [Evansella sp. AB-rgal1]|uniref:hypothetical protein n=1 Tax=Evansella sp. AB-rgal1 TaxID=3242696 RepID=UPI00359E6B05